MSAMTIVAPGRVQSWVRKYIKQFTFSSVWAQMSNVFEYGMPIPGAKEITIPSAVVTKISEEFRRGQYSATLISLRKPAAVIIGGPNSAEGKELNGTTKIVSVFYTNQRLPYALGDDSVMGSQEDFYGFAEAKTQLLTEQMEVDQTDYDHQMAMIEGSDLFLHSASAWDSSEYGSAISTPLAQTLHPNIYYWINGALTKNTWNEVYATAVANLETATDTELDDTDIFNLACLDATIFRLYRTITPLSGMRGNNQIKYVIKVSDCQMTQLETDTTTNQLRDLLKYTDKGFDQIINGFIGLYRGVALVVDQRAPIGTHSGTIAWNYVTPASPTVTRVAKGASTGTVEIAMGMGRGALGLVEVKGFGLVKKSKDYDFVDSICGARKRGTQRIDLDSAVAATSARINETSLLVITGTSAIGV